MRSMCVLLLAALVLASAVALAEEPYAFYYDRTPGRDVIVNVLNPAIQDVDYQITVYGAQGELLWSGSGVLEGLSGRYFSLGQLVPAGEGHWGLMIVECATPLIIGLEYIWEESLVSVDHITQRVPKLEQGVPYWLGAYHAQPEGRSTGLIVLNPWPDMASCTVSVYRQDGIVLYETTLSLAPHSSSFVNLSTVIGQGPFMWGLVDVEMADRAVVMALEYYGESVEVDNVSQPYYR